MKYNPVPNSNWPISYEYHSGADDKVVYGYKEPSLPEQESLQSQGPVVHWELHCLLYHTNKIMVCMGTTLPYPQN